MPNSLANPHGVNAHRWLLECKKEAGYEFTDTKGGECFGISYMAMQAIIANDLGSFKERLELICSKDLNFFKNLREKDSKTQEEVDILAFFDGIDLYYRISKHPELFENRIAPTFQRMEPALQFVQPVTIPEFNKIKMFTGVYNLNELTIYFNELHRAIKKNDLTNSLALILHTSNHTITVQYTPSIIDFPFILIDSNQLWLLQQPQIDSQQLANNILPAFNEKKTIHKAVRTIFTTEIYVKKEHEVKTKNALSELNFQKNWKKIHDVSIEKSKFFDRPLSLSWINLAIINDDTHTALTILKFISSNLNQDNQAAIFKHTTLIGCNALMHAIFYKSETVKPLLESILSLKDKKEIVAILKQRTSVGSNALSNAIVNNDTNTALTILNFISSNLDQKDQVAICTNLNGEHLLMDAIFYKSETVKPLLESILSLKDKKEIVAILKQRTSVGSNALNLAIFFYPEIVKPMLELIFVLEDKNLIAAICKQLINNFITLNYFKQNFPDEAKTLSDHKKMVRTMRNGLRLRRESLNEPKLKQDAYKVVSNPVLLIEPDHRYQASVNNYQPNVDNIDLVVQEPNKTVPVVSSKREPREDIVGFSEKVRDETLNPLVKEPVIDNAILQKIKYGKVTKNNSQKQQRTDSFAAVRALAVLLLKQLKEMSKNKNVYSDKLSEIWKSINTLADNPTNKKKLAYLENIVKTHLPFKTDSAWIKLSKLLLGFIAAVLVCAAVLTVIPTGGLSLPTSIGLMSAAGIAGALMAAKLLPDSSRNRNRLFSEKIGDFIKKVKLMNQNKPASK